MEGNTTLLVWLGLLRRTAKVLSLTGATSTSYEQSMPTRYNQCYHSKVNQDAPSHSLARLFNPPTRTVLFCCFIPTCGPWDMNRGTFVKRLSYRGFHLSIFASLHRFVLSCTQYSIHTPSTNTQVRLSKQSSTLPT